MPAHGCPRPTSVSSPSSLSRKAVTSCAPGSAHPPVGLDLRAIVRDGAGVRRNGGVRRRVLPFREHATGPGSGRPMVSTIYRPPVLPRRARAPCESSTGQRARLAIEVGQRRWPRLRSSARREEGLPARPEQRVAPLQAGKAREVGVGRVQGGAVLDGQGRNDGVHDQRTSHLVAGQEAPEDRPVALAGLEDARHAPLQPRGNRHRGFGG